MRSSSGNESLVCHGQLPEGTEPDKTVKQEDFLCGTGFSLTTDSQQIINANGSITLRCQVKVNALTSTTTAAAVDGFGFVGGDAVAQSAEQADGFPCGLGPAGLTEDSHAVLSSSGNETLTCRGYAENPSGETQNLKDVPCGMWFTGSATDSHFIWTASGEATLKCSTKS